MTMSTLSRGNTIALEKIIYCINLREDKEEDKEEYKEEDKEEEYIDIDDSGVGDITY